jgi:hypothetical protein
VAETREKPEMTPRFVAEVRSADSRRREGHWGREREVDHAARVSTRTMKRGVVVSHGTGQQTLGLEISPTNFLS